MTRCHFGICKVHDGACIFAKKNHSNMCATKNTHTYIYIYRESTNVTLAKTRKAQSSVAFLQYNVVVFLTSQPGVCPCVFPMTCNSQKSITIFERPLLTIIIDWAQGMGYTQTSCNLRVGTSNHDVLSLVRWRPESPLCLLICA